MALRRSSKRWLPLLLVALLLTACVGGGTSRFSVSGRVTDEHGQGIPDVEIVADGLAKPTTITDSEGYYTLTGLQGLTTIRAAKIGWEFSVPDPVNKETVIDFTGSVKSHLLSVTTVGRGTVLEEVVATARSTDYPHGTTVRLTAKPEDGWFFTHWEGDLTGNQNPVEVDITSEIRITAVFQQPASLNGTISVRHNFPRSVVDRSGSQYETPSRARIRPVDEIRASSIEPDPTELIIAFDDSVSPAEQIDVLAELGYQVLDKLEILNAYLVQKPAGFELGMLRAQSLPGVKYVEPNRQVGALSLTYPNDALYGDQWHLPLIRLPQAWSVTTGGSVRIAVLDSGIKTNHPDLASRIDWSYGYNFIGSNANFEDDNGHGTHVAGTIGAVTDNRLGIAGVMWDVEILPVKVLDRTGYGGEWNIAQGLLYAAGVLNEAGKPRNPYPADVINLSLGADQELPILHDAIETVLRLSPSIIVAAAGNDPGRRGNPVSYPAAYPGVIAVGAVDYNYPNQPQRAPYSNYGPELDVVAPGGDITRDSDGNGKEDGVLSTSIRSWDYDYMQGTSMATPHVSGLIGLMLSAGIPRQEIRDVLHRTSMPLGSGEFDSEYGYGLVNAYWAVNAVDKMRLIVGTRDGSQVTVVAETALSPKGGSFALEGIPPGEYQVFAWVDVQPGTDIIEPGDYFNESELIRFEGGRNYSVQGIITEVSAPGSPHQPPLEVFLQY